MKHLFAIGSALAAALGMAIAGTGRVAASADTPPPPSSPKFYASRATDIFNDNCLTCHDEPAKGGLRLDSYAGIMKGGRDGAVIVPGDPAASMLIQAIRRTGDLKMPPKRVLGDAEIADLEAWVKAGAVGADPAPASTAPANAARASTPVAVAAALPAKMDADFFENKIRPILANSCYDCHDETAKGGLRVDSKAAFEKGGKHGPVVIPGDPAKSLLIQAVQQTGDLKMPKGGKLKPEEVATL